MVKKMTSIERAKILGMLEAGLSIWEVHRRTGRAKSSIHQLTKKVETMGAERAVKTSPGCGKKVLASLKTSRSPSSMSRRSHSSV